MGRSILTLNFYPWAQTMSKYLRPSFLSIFLGLSLFPHSQKVLEKNLTPVEGSKKFFFRSKSFFLTTKKKQNKYFVAGLLLSLVKKNLSNVASMFEQKIGTETPASSCFVFLRVLIIRLTRVLASIAGQ